MLSGGVNALKVCLWRIPEPYFRTNIITGQCNYGLPSDCSLRDSWYYESGCNISEEEKLEVKKRSRYKNYTEFSIPIIPVPDIPEISE